MQKQELTTEIIEKRNKALVLVSELTGIGTEEIMGTCRKDPIVLARHLVMWTMCNQFGITTINTGLLMHRNSSSVVHGVSVINTDYRKSVKRYVEQIKQRLNGTEIK